MRYVSNWRRVIDACRNEEWFRGDMSPAAFRKAFNAAHRCDISGTDDTETVIRQMLDVLRLPCDM